MPRPPPDLEKGKKKKKGGMPTSPLMKVDKLLEAQQNVLDVTEEYVEAKKSEGASTEELEGAVAAVAAAPNVELKAKSKAVPAKGKKKMAAENVLEFDRYQQADMKNVEALLMPQSYQKARSKLGSEPQIMPRRMPVAAPKQMVLSRQQLFDKFGVTEHFPIDKVKDIVKMLEAGFGGATDDYVMVFTGVEQLTDLVFYTFKQYYNAEKFACVKVLALDGCVHLTDQALVYIALCFPQLTDISLNGCCKITESGLHHLLKGCGNLKKLKLNGTSISVLPRSIADKDPELAGCPLVSPDRDVFVKEGLKILKASSYPKPTDKDMVKMSVIRPHGFDKSLLKYLSSESDLSCDPLTLNLNVSLGSGIQANIIECDQVLSDMFITKRTLFILSYLVDDKAKGQTEELFGLMIFILAKVPTASFLFVGFSNKSGETGYMKQEIARLIREERKRMQPEIATVKDAKASEKLGFHDQQMLFGLCTVHSRLEFLENDNIYTEIQLSSREDTKKLKTAMERGAKNVIALHPEYQEIAAPTFKYLCSDSINSMVKDGALSMEGAKGSIQKMMGLSQLMGRVVLFEPVGGRPILLLLSWLVKLLNGVLAKPKDGATNKGRLPSVADDAPLWTGDELVKALTAALGKEGATTGVNVLRKLGMTVTTSAGFIPYMNLSATPTIPVEHYFTSAYKHMVQVSYSYEFSYDVPLSVIHHMVHLMSTLRRPVLLWQGGAIIQEAVVEILIQKLKGKGSEGCTLQLCGQTMKKTSMETKEILWHCVEQYKIVVDYVLNRNSLYHKCKVSSEGTDKPVHVAGLIGGHYMKVLTQNESGESEEKLARMCQKCGTTPIQSAHLWNIHRSLRKSFLDDSCIKMVDSSQKDAVTHKGSFLTFSKEGTCNLLANISSLEHNRCTFCIIGGDSKKVQIGIRSYSLVVTLDLNSGHVMGSRTGSTTSSMKMGELQKEKIPTMGDNLTFELSEISGEQDALENSCELSITNNDEVVAKMKIPNLTFQPVITGQPGVTIIAHSLAPVSSQQSSQITKGMRLEAWDRKTPTLVCVATIDEIAEDGRLLIHFDGWTKTYDYWAEPTSPDIHPVGYMKYNAKRHKNLNQELQAPGGKGNSTFQWAPYLTSNSAVPVPFEFFNEKQRESTQPDEYYRCLEALQSKGLGMMLQLGTKDSQLCSLIKHRAKVLEYQAMKKCTLSKDLFDFFATHSKFFCLLPRSFNLTHLKYPSLAAISDFSRLNVHILCPGMRMEVLHMVNHGGFVFPFVGPDIVHLLGYLQKCCLGLIIQDDIVPNTFGELCKGIDSVAQGDPYNYKDKIEIWMERLLFLYVEMVEFLGVKGEEGAEGTAVIELFSKAGKNEEIKNMFTDLDGFTKCVGHSAAASGGMELSSIPLDKLGNFTQFIEKLDFQNNFIERLPPDFFNTFSKLEYLSVANNQLVALPQDIHLATSLTYLDISMNNIVDLPDTFFKLGSSLTFLNISDNPLSKFPSDIFKFSKLEELYAENIGIIKTFKPIELMKGLKKMSVAKNSIEEIPDGIGDLPLVELDLSGVPWFQPLTSTKSFMTWQAFNKNLNYHNVLRQIDENERSRLFAKADIDESSTLQPNEILALNEVLFKKYGRFGTKTMEFKDTGGFPPMLLRMKTLKKLNLSYHGIHFVPDQIKDMTSLHDLNLSENPYLESLSAELGGLPLRNIHLRECPTLKTPPKEIVSRGFSSIFGYLKRLRLGSSPCKRTKLMLVGLGGAGKTSLVRALTSQFYQAQMDHGEEITDGINITNWPVPIPGEEPLTYSVWDFAGQTVYYNTHQFFLSDRAVYLLLWNIRLGYEHAGLDFWLSSVACHAPKAPIFVVGTHCDKVEKSKMNQKELSDRFPQIKGFFYVSSYTGEGIAELKKSLIKITLEQEYMGERIPQAWLTLEQTLYKHRKEKMVDVIRYGTVEGLAAQCGIFEKNELLQAIQFLHDLGAVQFFNTDFLRSQIVIYPQWIVDVMKCVVTVHEGPIKDGKLKLADMKRIWAKYPVELHPWLLRLTEEFDLTCPLLDEEANIVPCLLPSTEPHIDWPHADQVKNIKESKTIYQFKYLPAGLFNRAQVRLHQFSDGSLLWKKGSFLKKNEHIALMLQTGRSQVHVKAQGFRPENILFMVHEVFETLINEAYSGVQYDFFVPCVDCQNMNVKDPSMFSSTKLQRALELHAPFLQCDKFFHTISIPELQSSFPPDKTSDFDEHLRKGVHELIDLKQEVSINTVFCYSMKNVPDLSQENTMVHPGTIMEDLRDKEFKVSFVDNPETADVEALTLTVKAADVVLIGMSDEFCDNENCKKLLLYIKDILRKPILLVLLGKTKNWMKTDLNLSFGTEVFVSMQDKGRYEHKIKELYDSIRKKVSTAKKEEESPGCFISYCWTNSKDAIDKGTKAKPGSLGWGDPRKMKEFLAEKGVPCWLDIERVGAGGLYEDIAAGLRKAKVFVACVSDEYVKSKNCVMEFRFALSTLKIPLVVAVVGTGYAWERSEIGMLAVGHECKKINFQYQNEAGNLELMKFVQDNMPKSAAPKSGEKKVNPETQRKTAFQEVVELTQRKFLRHVSAYAETMDTSPYPRLISIDRLTADEKKKKLVRRQTKSVMKIEVPEDQKEDAEKGDGKKEGKKEGSEVETTEELVHKSKYCFRLLCEYEQGWHPVSPSIPFPKMTAAEEKDFLMETAVYMGRLLAILKHSDINLLLLTTPEGDMLQQMMEEVCLKSKSEFNEEYQQLRKKVMDLDKDNIMGRLNRCHLLNGKIAWLCDEHKMVSGSKTEVRYKDQLISRESVDNLPEAQVPIREQTFDEEPEVSAKPRQIFKKPERTTSEDPKTASKLKRQTSQACEVM